MCNQNNHPCATGVVTAANKKSEHVYDITFKFDANDCPDISNLSGIYISNTGVYISELYHYIYAKSYGINEINDACHWTATFEVSPVKRDSLLCIPNFLVNYAWNTKNEHNPDWLHYKPLYAYSVSCKESGDGISDGDFPEYCWPVHQDNVECSTSTVKTIKTTSTTTTNSFESKTITKSTASFTATINSTTDTTIGTSDSNDMFNTTLQNSSISSFETTSRETFKSTFYTTITSCDNNRCKTMTSKVPCTRTVDSNLPISTSAVEYSDTAVGITASSCTNDTYVTIVLTSSYASSDMTPEQTNIRTNEHLQTEKTLGTSMQSAPSSIREFKGRANTFAPTNSLIALIIIGLTEMLI